MTAVNACKSESNKPKTTRTSNLSTYSSQQTEEIVRTFAIAYQPDSLAYEYIGKLGKAPDSVVAAFKALRLTNSTAHNKWLTLIFLKLYLDHLRCCHQGYELRNNTSGGIDSTKDPLVYEFAVSTKLVDVTKRIEFLNSGIGEIWLLKNPLLTSDPEIKRIVASMKPIKDSIANGLYR